MNLCPPKPPHKMKTAARKYAAEQGMAAKSKEFVEKGAEVYAKA